MQGPILIQYFLLLDQSNVTPARSETCMMMINGNYFLRLKLENNQRLYVQIAHLTEYKLWRSSFVYQELSNQIKRLFDTLREFYVTLVGFNPASNSIRFEEGIDHPKSLIHITCHFEHLIKNLHLPIQRSDMNRRERDQRAQDLIAQGQQMVRVNRQIRYGNSDPLIIKKMAIYGFATFGFFGALYLAGTSVVNLVKKFSTFMD